MFIKPQAEHEWLQGLVGNWTFEAEAIGEPGEMPYKSSGTEIVRSLGGLWVVCEGQSSMPDGSAAATLMTIGYDPGKERFLGTWVGSMMTHMWVYEGTLNAGGKVLPLESEGPDFMTPGLTRKYQDVIEIKSADLRLLTSRVLGDDGAWNEFMRAEYRRTN